MWSEDSCINLLKKMFVYTLEERLKIVKFQSVFDNYVRKWKKGKSSPI